MKRTVLLGYRRFMIPLPSLLFRRRIRQNAKAAPAQLAFMSEEHHRVRDFCVRELHRVGEPLSPSLIAERLGLAVDRVNTLLDELEKRKIFVFRNGGRDVVWAYPVTMDTTPHRITYSSGEEGFAA